MTQIIEDIQQGYLFIYEHKVYMKTNCFHYSEKLSDYINAVRLSDGELFALPDKILVYVYDFTCNDLNKAEFDYLKKRGDYMSFTTFQQIGKARRAAELSRTGIKVIINNGVFYQFPDGHKMPIHSTIDLKPETIGAWLQVLYTIRQERQGKR